MHTVYDFPVILPDGRTLDWQTHRGRVLLLTNTASRCAFTPQLAGLEALQQQYAAAGFSVLGFPCNQFGGQEPGSDAEIALFCRQSYAVTFPLSRKIDVNGPAADPLWRFMQQQQPGLGGLAAIKWNFTKFLIDRHGRVHARFAPLRRPESLRPAIEHLLTTG